MADTPENFFNSKRAAAAKAAAAEPVVEPEVALVEAVPQAAPAPVESVAPPVQAAPEPEPQAQPTLQEWQLAESLNAEQPEPQAVAAPTEEAASEPAPNLGESPQGMQYDPRMTKVDTLGRSIATAHNELATAERAQRRAEDLGDDKAANDAKADAVVAKSHIANLQTTLGEQWYAEPASMGEQMQVMPEQVTTALQQARIAQESHAVARRKAEIDQGRNPGVWREFQDDTQAISVRSPSGIERDVTSPQLDGYIRWLEEMEKTPSAQGSPLQTSPAHEPGSTTIPPSLQAKFAEDAAIKQKQEEIEHIQLSVDAFSPGAFQHDQDLYQSERQRLLQAQRDLESLTTAKHGGVASGNEVSDTYYPRSRTDIPLAPIHSGTLLRAPHRIDQALVSAREAQRVLTARQTVSDPLGKFLDPISSKAAAVSRMRPSAIAGAVSSQTMMPPPVTLPSGDEITLTPNQLSDYIQRLETIRDETLHETGFTVSDLEEQHQSLMISYGEYISTPGNTPGDDAAYQMFVKGEDLETQIKAQQAYEDR